MGYRLYHDARFTTTMIAGCVMSDSPNNYTSEKREPPHHPGLGLVRVTEEGALAAARWVGLDQRHTADEAAHNAVTSALRQLPMRGYIVSGEEGRVGENTLLDSGCAVGSGTGPEMDVEINAIDGATLVADGRPGSMSVAALAPRGTLWSPGPAVYLQKLVVDRTVADAIGPDALDAPPAWTLATVARAKGKDIRDLAVFILDRPRHAELIKEVRQAGARVLLRIGGDIGGAMMAADPNVSVDALMGIGGAAEGLMASCAVKALGGAIMARVTPQSEAELRACQEGNVDLKRILTRDDLVSGDEVFFSATGITDGGLLRGIDFHGGTATSHSLVLRYETGTRRVINTEHRLK
ncbi:MAG: fructose-1,6-bisphosphatase II [Candidatus Krumholzibacteriia bacterium]|jgi:fructose-1,6-bisphosphatase II